MDADSVVRNGTVRGGGSETGIPEDAALSLHHLERGQSRRILVGYRNARRGEHCVLGKRSLLRRPLSSSDPPIPHIRTAGAIQALASM